MMRWLLPLSLTPPLGLWPSLVMPRHRSTLTYCSSSPTSTSESWECAQLVTSGKLCWMIIMFSMYLLRRYMCKPLPFFSSSSHPLLLLILVAWASHMNFVPLRSQYLMASTQVMPFISSKFTKINMQWPLSTSAGKTFTHFLPSRIDVMNTNDNPSVSLDGETPVITTLTSSYTEGSGAVAVAGNLHVIDIDPSALISRSGNSTTVIRSIQHITRLMSDLCYCSCPAWPSLLCLAR